MAIKYLNDTSTTELVTKVKNLVATKQDALVSGTNIKTINNTSLLGSGNIDIHDITQITSKTNIWELTDGVYFGAGNLFVYKAKSKTIGLDSTPLLVVVSTLGGSKVYNAQAYNLLIWGIAHATAGVVYQKTLDNVLIQADIINNLTSASTTAPLSANQGYVLDQNKLDKTSSMIPSNNTVTYSTAPTTGTTLMTAPANGVAYVRYALTGTGAIGVHLRTSGNQDLAYNTQNFDTNGYHIYTATFVMKSGQKLYCYENALSNNWGAIIFVKSEGQS